jgi:hypothetical protein
MATVTTTTNTNPLQYPGTTLLVKLGGRNRYVALVKGSTADNYLFYVSTDTGASWSLNQTIVRTNVTDVGALHWDNGDFVTWAYRTNESSQDRLYVRRLGMVAGTSTTECLVANPGNGGVAGTYHTAVDVRAVSINSTTIYIVVAAGTQIGGNQGATLYGAVNDQFGNVTANNGILKGTRQWMFTAASGRCGVSLDFQHDGGGSLSSTPHLWVLFGRASLYLAKLQWTGAGWTGPSGTTQIAASTGNRDYTVGRYTGQVFNIVYPDPAATDRVVFIERDAANTTTTIRPQCPAHPTGVIRQATLAYTPNYSPGDVRVFAVGTSTAVVYYVDWVRATNTWTSWTTTGIAAVIGTNADNWSVKPSSSGDARDMVYTATGTTPFTLSVTAQTLTYAPNIPTWVTPTTPASGSAWDVATILPLDWAFTDNDPGDTQSAFAVSKQIGAGALTFWRASDSTWQVAEVQNTSGTTALNVPAATMLAADAATTFKVKVWDSSSTASQYSAGVTVIPSTPVNPSITAPTAAQVLTTNSVTMTWTAAEQTQFRVQLFVTAGAQVYDSGWINDGSSRSYLVPYVLLNSTNWTLHLQTANNEGLASVDQTRQFTISYIPPMTPTTLATPLALTGIMQVVITNPTPGGGAPAVASQDLYRRVTGSGDPTGVRVAASLANNATYQDWQAVGGVSYDYRSVVTGVNGTTSSGVFTA